MEINQFGLILASYMVFSGLMLIRNGLRRDVTETTRGQA